MGRKERLTMYWRRLRGLVIENEASKCGIGKREEAIPALSPADDRHYEDLISGRIPSRTGVEKMIQKLTRKDAGVVLAMLGMDHPASGTVYRYLVQQKCDQYGYRCGYLLMRKRVDISLPSGKTHSQEPDPRDQDPAAGSAF